MSEPTGTEYPEEGQPVTTPEPEIEAVEEAAVEAEALDLADAADEYEAEVGNAAEIPVVYTERPVQTVGRRKEAVVRVRLVPGTGKFNLNGRTLEAYFPNKVHQQLIKDPLVTVDRADAFDIFAHLDGGGPSGQAGALRLAIARALILVHAEDRPALKKAGFLTRDPAHRAQEVRPEEGPQGAAVQQALIAAPCRCAPRSARTASAGWPTERCCMRRVRPSVAGRHRRRAACSAEAAAGGSARPPAASPWSAAIRGPAARCSRRP